MCVQSSYVSILYLISSTISGYNFESTLMKKYQLKSLKKSAQNKAKISILKKFFSDGKKIIQFHCTNLSLLLL